MDGCITVFNHSRTAARTAVVYAPLLTDYARDVLLLRLLLRTRLDPLVDILEWMADSRVGYSRRIHLSIGLFVVRCSVSFQENRMRVSISHRVAASSFTMFDFSSLRVRGSGLELRTRHIVTRGNGEVVNFQSRG